MIWSAIQRKSGSSTCTALFRNGASAATAIAIRSKRLLPNVPTKVLLQSCRRSRCGFQKQSAQVFSDDSRLQRKRSGLSSGSLNFSHAVSIPSSSTTGRADTINARRLGPAHIHGAAVDLNRYHFLFHPDPASTKKTTGPTANDFQFENGRPRRDQCGDSWVDREREGDNRHVKGGR